MATRTSRPKSKARSIQGNGRRTSGRSYAAKVNERTKRHAYNHGKPWEDDDVDTLIQMTEKDERTEDIAYATGRTFYATSYARAHWGFAQRHRHIFKKHL